MRSLRSWYHIVRADFYERSRSYGFLAAIVLTVLAAYFFVPVPGAGYAVVTINEHRGVYNSAWIGATVAMSTITTLSLIGFALVKNAIDRDRVSRVGQIIATTPVSRLGYLLGKFVSNLIVLAVIVAITLAVSAAMQIIRSEDTVIRFFDLAMPFAAVVLPVMALVAALAVLFEAIPPLGGGIGIIVYFFLWSQVFLNYGVSFELGGVVFSSLMGQEIFYDSMIDAFRAEKNFAGPIAKADGIIEQKGELLTFVWNGPDWTAGVVAGRLIWIAVALAVVLLAAWIFKGFDKAAANESFDLLSLFKRKKAAAQDEGWESNSGLTVTALSRVSMEFSFFNLLRYELWLMLKGQKWWWYAVTLLLVTGNLILPFEAVRSIVGPITWVWPILLWSSMGVRELKNHTSDIIFSGLSPLRRQIPASWCAGFAIALATGIGLAVRLLLAGNLAGVFAWLVGAMFIPTLALALGIWTRSNKTFEVVFLLIMFVGVMNQLQALDFMGSMETSVEKGIPLVYLIMTVLLMPLILLGRKKQLQR